MVFSMFSKNRSQEQFSKTRIKQTLNGCFLGLSSNSSSYIYIFISSKYNLMGKHGVIFVHITGGATLIFDTDF